MYGNVLCSQKRTMENANELASIVMPVYNSQDYLEQTLEWIAAQTYENFEVLMVDDGSTDRSPEICRAYEQKDPRFRYIRQENAGPSAARNHGIRCAKGKYISFVDSDDMLHRSALERMVETITRENAQFVIGLYALYHDGQDPETCVARNQKDMGHGNTVLDQKGLASYFTQAKTSLLGVSVWGKLYLAEIIKRYDVAFPLDIHYEEDCCFNLQYYAHVEKAVQMSDLVYYYRMRSVSLSKKYNAKQFPFLINGYKERMKFVQRFDDPAMAEGVDEVFFIVIQSQMRKIAASGLSFKEKKAAYRAILGYQQTQRVIQTRKEVTGKAAAELQRVLKTGDVNRFAVFCELQVLFQRLRRKKNILLWRFKRLFEKKPVQIS